MTWRRTAGRLAHRRVDGRVGRCSAARPAPVFTRGHRRRTRRQRVVPHASSRTRSRRLDGDGRLGADAGLERPPRRLGRATPTATGSRTSTWRSPRACPIASSGPRGDGDVRGRHRARGARRARRHGAVAVRRRRQRRRSGPGARRPGRSRCCFRERRQRAASRPLRDAFRFDAADPGLADVDRDGRLRPRRLPRPLPLRLLVLLRRRRGQGGTPMPYHDARNGPPGVLFRNDGRGRFVDATREVGDRRRRTTATTSRPPGPTTTPTAGSTCSSRTTSAPRTSTATAGGRAAG